MDGIKYGLAFGGTLSLVATFMPLNKGARVCFVLLTILLFVGATLWHVHGKYDRWTPQSVMVLIIGTCMYAPSLLGMALIYMFSSTPDTWHTCLVWLIPPIVVVALGLMLVSRLPIEKAGFCARCGYNLKGLSGRPCPECGTVQRNN